MEYWKFSVEEVIRTSVAFNKWYRRVFFQLPMILIGFVLIWSILIAAIYAANYILLSFGMGVPVDFSEFGDLGKMIYYRWFQISNSRLVARIIFQKAWTMIFLADWKPFLFLSGIFLAISYYISSKVSKLVKSWLFLRLYNKLNRLFLQEKLYSQNDIVNKEIKILFSDPKSLSLASKIEGIARLVSLVAIHKI